MPDKDIPIDDIYQVVYKYDLKTLISLKSEALPISVEDNQMARWLKSSSGGKVIYFLILAKSCEWLRQEHRSPWYYPSKNDPVKFALEKVAKLARKMTLEDHTYGDRYALQAVRAMTSLQQYKKIISFWNVVEKNFTDDLMRSFTLREK